ncbi:hypothetical protein SAMN05421510_11083 [Nitrosomonas ureae]|uniref:Uncharacterized protein n=1 Tax=Nitrosomonas ureae TaxID=44577 RepID=A0A1H9HG64_9PROT|nr:hypothetical protein SAMN05421510_11083 [Nitrosomonas ureae]
MFIQNNIRLLNFTDIYQHIHGRPLSAKLSVNDFEQVKIAAIHPDFV